MENAKADQILEHDKALFAKGSEDALCDAFLLCHQLERPIPNWMAEACLARLQLIAQGDEKAILNLMRKNQKLTKHLVRNLAFEDHLNQGVGWKRAIHGTVNKLVKDGIEEKPSYDAVKESVMVVRSAGKQKLPTLSRKSLIGRSPTARVRK